MAFVAGMAHVSQGVPSGDGGGDGTGNPAGPDDTVSPTVSGDPGNLCDPRGPSAAGKSRGTAGDILQILGSLHAPECGRDTAPGAGVLSNRPLQLCPIPGASVAGWTAEDLAFIRLSLNPFLDQLSLVIRNIRSLGIPPRQSLS
ncbi:hypothetical protein MJG53_019870 [Ovis ammon polii x Ovis aries]|uniref:Uncharacterized protein n=1 Tax=Ovis ammon polii x Ovis aries TaxID=2918886 RepID=A0ACB9U0T7_9CETA|nr:hypothetical protein MJG53_019870 [Ovis ammon polii x Ovis aries]